MLWARLALWDCICNDRLYLKNLNIGNIYISSKIDYYNKSATQTGHVWMFYQKDCKLRSNYRHVSKSFLSCINVVIIIISMPLKLSQPLWIILPHFIRLVSDYKLEESKKHIDFNLMQQWTVLYEICVWKNTLISYVSLF